LLCVGFLLTSGLRIAEGICAPSERGNKCSVIRGVTSILLDRGAAEVKAVAYAVIDSVLQDADFIREFTASNLVQAEFVRPIGENLVILGNTQTPEVPKSSRSNSSATAKIAITAAFTSFFLTAVIFYGVFRSQQQKAELERGRTKVKARLAHYQAKRRQYFQQLQEDQRLGPGWMTTNPLQMPGPSVTWSISDLTSDSQSIKSSLRMDRIDEEGPSDEYEANYKSEDFEPGPDRASGEHVSFDFVARWGEPKTVSQYATSGGSSTQVYKDEECPSTVWEVPEGPSPLWENTVREYVDVEAQTPRRRNRIEDFDATTEPHSLLGCRILEDSMEEVEETGLDLDTSNLTDPTEDDDSELLYSEPNTPIHRDGGKEAEDFSDFHTPSGYHPEDVVLDALDLILEHWFQHLLIQLARARTQKRITM